MLVLSRKVGESIWMPHLNIEVRVIELRNRTVSLGIVAPKDVTVLRDDAIDTRGIDLQLYTGVATDGAENESV